MKVLFFDQKNKSSKIFSSLYLSAWYWQQLMWQTKSKAQFVGQQIREGKINRMNTTTSAVIRLIADTLCEQLILKHENRSSLLTMVHLIIKRLSLKYNCCYCYSPSSYFPFLFAPKKYNSTTIIASSNRRNILWLLLVNKTKLHSMNHVLFTYKHFWMARFSLFEEKEKLIKSFIKTK